MSRAPATAPAVTAAVGAALAARVERFMGQAPLFTAELWGEVGRRSAAAGPEMSELVDAARAADGGKYVRPRLVATAFFGLESNERFRSGASSCGPPGTPEVSRSS